MNDLSLSNEQYKMLCKIKRHGGISRSSLSVKEFEICQYLFTQDCIVKMQRTPTPWQLDRSQNHLPENIAITQFGEAQIYTFRSKFRKWWIPVIISIISLIVSIVAPIAQVLL